VWNEAAKAWQEKPEMAIIVNVVVSSPGARVPMISSHEADYKADHPFRNLLVRQD
jgi:hypothetical protein